MPPQQPILVLFSGVTLLSACKEGKDTRLQQEPIGSIDPAPVASAPSPVTNLPNDSDLPIFAATPLKGPLASHKELCTHFEIWDSDCAPKKGLLLDVPRAPFEAAQAVIRRARPDREIENPGTCEFGIKVGVQWFLGDELLSCMPEAPAS
ncbi:MAG: hypothetical protein GY811_07240 [Myxococcales bacterium]|nr:hypothetical protein [Myxococcales bacterium]